MTRRTARLRARILDAFINKGGQFIGIVCIAVAAILVVIFQQRIKSVADEFNISLSSSPGKLKYFGKMSGVGKPACLDFAMKQ